jgi:Protein of unknown function (DUF2721)
MDSFGGNPFIVLTFIAAPAVLTNACAVMSLTTSNRIARAVDRGRALVKELSRPEAIPAERRQFRLREVEVAQRRAVLLIEAMGSFQFACAGFATTTILALVGAALGFFQIHALNVASLTLVLSCQSLAVAGIVRGSSKIIRESRLAYTVLRQEADQMLDTFLPHG